MQAAITRPPRSSSVGDATRPKDEPTLPHSQRSNSEGDVANSFHLPATSSEFNRAMESAAANAPAEDGETALPSTLVVKRVSGKVSTTDSITIPKRPSGLVNSSSESSLM